MTIDIQIRIMEDDGTPSTASYRSGCKIYAPLESKDILLQSRLTELILNNLHELHASDDFIEGFGECRNWQVTDVDTINSPMSKKDWGNLPNPFTCKDAFPYPASIRKIQEQDNKNLK
jgi:hypothetical protein